MNMGVADAFDLGWKLAAVFKGFGGEGLLQSYEVERKPVAERNVARSGDHFGVHLKLKEFLAGGDPKRVDENTGEAKELRKMIHDYYQVHDSENKDFGIEMGYRYRSTIVVPDESSSEPAWLPSQYMPTTWPGGRPPHVFLSNGSTLFDHFGKYWTLLVFVGEEVGQSMLVEAAEAFGMPLTVVDLSNEPLAKDLYERQLVLVRPDQHVSWRANSVGSDEEARSIFEKVSGRLQIPNV